MGHLHKPCKAQELREPHRQVICFIVHYFPSLFICQGNIQEIIYLLTNSDNLKTVPRTFAMSWFQLPPLIPWP